MLEAFDEGGVVVEVSKADELVLVTDTLNEIPVSKETDFGFHSHGGSR